MFDEKQMVSRFLKSKSEEDFLALYRNLTPQIYGFAESLCNQPEDAKELIQEMWIVALRKLPGFEFKSQLKTWLIQILINISKEKNRKNRKTEHLDNIIPEQNFSQSTEILDLRKAISQLPKGYRTVFILHDISGYKHREISGLLDISEGTSKSQLHRARNTLKRFLTKG